MAQVTATGINRPAWVDLAATDSAKERDYYAQLFGWQIDVNPDPQYGGYGLAKVGGHDAAGIGPKQQPDVPTAWTVYIGTDDVEDLAKRVEAAGGRVIAPPFDVGDQGRMAVFQDPAGAFFSAWQRGQMGGFQTNEPNSFAWAELNARGVTNAIPFYADLFGWTIRSSEMGEGQPPYNEFLLDGESIAGAWEMNPTVPQEVPSYWQVYFAVQDVDAAFRRALQLGGQEMVGPQEYPGGRFAIVSDPEGASFGLMEATRQ